MAPSILGELNISAAIKVPFLSRGLTLKPSFEKILEAHRPLLTISEVSLGETHSIS